MKRKRSVLMRIGKLMFENGEHESTEKDGNYGLCEGKLFLQVLIGANMNPEIWGGGSFGGQM